MSKKPSGAANRRRTKEREKETDQCSSLLSSWLNGKDVRSTDDNSKIAEHNEGSSIQEKCTSRTEVGAKRNHQGEFRTAEKQHTGEVAIDFQPSIESEPHSATTDEPTNGFFPKSATPMSDIAKDEPPTLDLTDPGKWPSAFSDAERCFIVSGLMNAVKTEPDLCNTLREGRNLTKDWFTKQLPGGLKVQRTWLAYSKSKNSLFCVPCKLFSHMFPGQKISVLAKEEGFTNWKKLSERIPEHENSLIHKHCFCSWKTLELSLNKGLGVDKGLQDQIAEEETHWRGVLFVIIDVIINLAKQGSPLRGSQEHLDFGDPRCGKFLNTIELISHYHPPLKEHIRRHKKGQVSYFSPYIQNEFLEIISGKIRQHIIEDIKTAKYFSIMFDCTPDISHSEQMSQVLRYVKITESGPEITESFIDFIKVSEKTGQALSEEILAKLKNDGLDIKDCRGQSYDNGSNMAGACKGVQTRIQKENSLAFFVPCAAHSLNLVGANAAKLSPDADSFFGMLNYLYNFFASSTNRWLILKKHVPISLKLQSSTRWSSKKEAVNAVYKHLGKIIEALNELKDSAVATAETKMEASSILKNVKKFDFIVLCCFWFKELSRIDIVNKLFQSHDITIDRATNLIKSLIEEFELERSTIAVNAIKEAKEIANDLNIDPSFKEVRKRKKKRMFDEKCEDESGQFTEEKKFEILTVQIIDSILNALRERFQLHQKLSCLFGFLNGTSFQKMSREELKAQAAELADVYDEDLEKEELVVEVESFKSHALSLLGNTEKASPSVLLTLMFQNKLEAAYPNITSALRMFLTIPVSVASNERSFSKLKIINNYLRNLTGQNRKTNLSIISIEHKLASKLSFDDIVKTFAAKKARKIKL